MVVYKTGEQTIYYGRFICLTIAGTKIQRILSKLQRLRTMRAAALLWPGVPSAKKIPVFAMTANAFIEDKQRSKEVGMNEHLSKPLDEKTTFST